MSDTSFLPGGPEVPSSSLINGDGATITAVNRFGSQLTTDLGSGEGQSVPIEGILAGGAYPIGTPIYAKPGSPYIWAPAYADYEQRSTVVGLLSKAAVLDQPVTFRDRGLLELTIAEWEAINVDGTALVPGLFYYLNDNASAKPLTKLVPDSDNAVLLGFAITPTILKVNINFQSVAIS